MQTVELQRAGRPWRMVGILPALYILVDHDHFRSPLYLTVSTVVAAATLIFMVVHSSILLACQRLLVQALVAGVVSSQVSVPQYDRVQIQTDLQIYLCTLHGRQSTTIGRAAC